MFDFGHAEPDVAGKTFYNPVLNQNEMRIYMENNWTPSEAVSTFVHESSHAVRAARGHKIGTQLDELRASRREFLFREGRRPSYLDRLDLWETVKRSSAYRVSSESYNRS
jgi:hypothetical protein